MRRRLRQSLPSQQVPRASRAARPRPTPRRIRRVNRQAYEDHWMRDWTERFEAANRFNAQMDAAEAMRGVPPAVFVEPQDYPGLEDQFRSMSLRRRRRYR